jgi:hypothetical protein
MKRVSIGDGRWFDADKATAFKEETDWDGSNHISRATGSQWEHERLYRTAAYVWILNHWSNWQGSEDRWEVVDKEEAAAWLVKNDIDPTPNVEQEYAALEIK